MRFPNPRHIAPLLLVIATCLTVGCSTQKNTAKSRWWHSFNARYNTYYNGTLAYIDGSLEKENGNKDNFTEVIPLYPVGNKASKEIGKGNFEKAIEKSQKAIKLHSIKRRPEWNKSRRKTEKDLEWLNRKEYNPFLWKAWMLMGRAQFHKGAFDEAASTFSYMSRLYQSQPAIYGRARAWLAKCYIEQDWMYDAEDVIRNMHRDSIHWRAQKEWDYTLADYHIHTGDYAQAIPYLRKVIKHEMRRKQKAREWFLLGQLEAALGHTAQAYKAYQRVIRLNPPYEIAFNARIAMTEVMAGGQSKKMIGRLRRMAASDNNKEYQDQIYYAIGNIYMSQRDTTHAIAAYEKGNSRATRNGIEKGVLLLRLGDIYWEKERYNDAQRCYGEAIGLLDKERKDYAELSQRSKVLDELVPYTDAVHMQDSLQELAKMSETDRNAAIDRVIEALKKKEKEERKQLAEQNAQNVMLQNGGNQGREQNTRNNSLATVGGQKNGLWYFYNPLTVSQGKETFQKQWGKRENTDDWQRINKTVVALDNDQPEWTDAQLDSIAQAEAVADSLAQIADSAQNDPHKREYYLAQIPFSEDQVAASNLIIQDGLYHSGVIFKDKLDNLPLSEKALRRLTDQYPDYEGMADVYYHLFLLYSRQGNPSMADTYIEQLKAQYPDNEWTTLLTDPYFAENARMGIHIEDSLYAATYDAFKADRHGEVRTNTGLSASRFPLGYNRDKFLFIGGLSKLNAGDAEGCIDDMKTVVEKFPQSRLSEMAGMIINGVNAGKRLRGGKFDMDNVWERRSAVLNDSDSIQARKLLSDRNVNFIFMFAYHPDSLNENLLLYELARYNFTSYMVRNFDISIEEADGLHRMQVAGFRNFDEALLYTRQLYQQPSIVKRAGKSRAIIISESNLELLGTLYSYDDYDKFYAKHFAPLNIVNPYLLSEPVEIATEKETEPTPINEEDADTDINEGTLIEQGTDLEGDTETTPPADDGMEVSSEDSSATLTDDTTIIEENLSDTGKETNGDTIIMEDEDKGNATETGGTTIISSDSQEQEYQSQPTTLKDDSIIEQPAVSRQSANRPQSPLPPIEDIGDIEDTGIDFNEDLDRTDVTQPATENSKEILPDDYDLDDEYYDLDGF